MSREWKPGDVARIIRDDGSETVGVFSKYGYGFQCAEGGGAIVERRPLVVVDPEDREQVERLTSIAMDVPQPFSMRIDDMQAALREFANPTPPKPPEPTGLGAVVEDADGDAYVRYDRGSLAPWIAATPNDHDRPCRYYADLNIVRVLSEGVTS